jgi:hypothetical protein
MRNRRAVLIPIKDQIELLFCRKERKEHKDEPFLLRLFFLCDLCVLCG